jgi:hypothetical protein
MFIDGEWEYGVYGVDGEIWFDYPPPIGFYREYVHDMDAEDYVSAEHSSVAYAWVPYDDLDWVDAEADTNADIDLWIE